MNLVRKENSVVFVLIELTTQTPWSPSHYKVAEKAIKDANTGSWEEKVHDRATKRKSLKILDQTEVPKSAKEVWP